MEESRLVWGLTIAAIAGLLAFDFVFRVRKAHVPTLREAAIRSPFSAPRYRQKVHDEPALIELLERARDSHDTAVRRGEAVASPPPHS